MDSLLETADYWVLAACLGALVAVAIWVLLRRKTNSADYLMVGRNVGWFVIGASIFASNIGLEHVVGLAVIYTETIQTIVLIAGSIVITVSELQEVRWWQALKETTESDLDIFSLESS